MNRTGINAPLPHLQDGGTAHSERLPVLHLALGRDRTGVTAHLHAVVQHYRERGANLRIWATGLYRLTRTLSDLHADAAKPPQSALDEIESWLEEQVRDQQERGYDAVLDLDEGAVLLRQLEAVSALTQSPVCGVRVVLTLLVGTATADTDLLRRVLRERWFASQQMLILLDENLVSSGSAETALRQVLSVPAVREAQEKGALVLRFPRWGFRDDVLGYWSAAKQENTTFLAEERVRMWWEERIPEMFEAIPPTWMPAVRGS